MAKLLKITGIILSILILLLVTTVFLLTMFVSPNRFKPLIVEQVKKNVGRDLSIDGDLSWSFFPNLGMKVGHMVLNNPAGFKQKTFAEIQNATLSVQLLPLLHGQIESKGILLDGMKLYLIKNAKGKTNWEDLQKPTASEAKTEIADEGSPKKAAISLAILGLDITHANINWIDEKANQNLDINQFELHAKEISLAKPFPFKTAFKFVGKNPNIAGEIAFSTRISLNLADQIFELTNTQFDATIQKDKKINMKIKTDVLGDLNKQTVQFDDLTGQIANMNFTGKVNINQFMTQPKVIGKMQVQPFNAKQLLATLGYDQESLKTINNLSGDFDFTFTAPKNLTVNGKIALDELKTSTVQVTKVNVRTQLKNNILDLNPITGAFYQGKMKGNAKVNLATAIPQISFIGKLENVQAEPLMEDVALNKKIKVTGTGNVDVQVTTMGKTGDAFIKNLNGTMKVSVLNGILKGIDIGYYVDTAHAFFSKEGAPGNNTEQTSFGSLTANFVIKNGIISNNDLKLASPRFETNGRGTISLVDQLIDYHVQTFAKQKTPDEKNNLMNLYHMPIPILLTGSLNKPDIRLDRDVLIQALAAQQTKKVKTVVQAKIQDKLKDKLPEEAVSLINGFLGQ